MKNRSDRKKELQEAALRDLKQRMFEERRLVQNNIFLKRLENDGY
jgi:hypothetical protein